MKIKLLKYLLMSMAILLPATSIYADNLSVEPFALRPGESHVVTVNMSNSKNYTAFQVDITLPDNVEILEQNHEYVVLSERASNSHLFLAFQSYLTRSFPFQPKPPFL